jgi:amino acid permease
MTGWAYWKHWVAQIATGTVTLTVAYYATRDWLPDLIHIGVCTYVIGPC